MTIKQLNHKINKLQASFDTFLKFYLANYPRPPKGKGPRFLQDSYKLTRDEILKELDSQEK